MIIIIVVFIILSIIRIIVYLCDIIIVRSIIVSQRNTFTGEFNQSIFMWL